MNKIAGIALLLAVTALATALSNPQFLSATNLENLFQRTALFGILSVGAALVILVGGIDLSIGSLVGLSACLLARWVTDFGWSPPLAVLAVLGLCAGLGWIHGVLVVRAGMQPFVVTLCGLLIYRGVARWWTEDRVLGFGQGEHDGLRALATAAPLSAPTLMALAGSAAWILVRFASERATRRTLQVTGSLLLGLALVEWAFGLPLYSRGEPATLSDVEVRAPFLILLGLSLGAALFLERTVPGRHLYAIGQNPRAAHYCGLPVERLTISAYVACATCAGLGGVLFALHLNVVQPSAFGNFYELYAIAAAVLGGFSLRGGEGRILGVLVGAALIRVLYNSINLLGIPTQLEFAIIGTVLLFGVLADELLRRRLRRGRTG